MHFSTHFYNNLTPHVASFAPCKVIQDNIRFWTPRCGFRIPGAGFRILLVHIPDSKTQRIPDFSCWFAPNFYISFSRNDFNGGFRNWRTCSVNACLFIHISITTFDNFKKYITANQGINFFLGIPVETVWLLTPMSIHSKFFQQLWRGLLYFFHSGSSRFFK